jgi:hypothetical protein
MAISDKDIEKMKGHFATKDDLQKFATKDDLKQFKDEVLGGLDEVMGELEKVREDRVFAKADDDRQNLRLDGLEGRMQKVEAKVG